MIRKANRGDIASVVKIYDAILDDEEAGNRRIGWVRGVYPTFRTAEEAFEKGTLFVCEDDGKIVAAAKIDREQVPEYADCHWEYDAPADKVMVLHTLVVHPACSRQGYGSEFVHFYEKYGLENGCPYLRMDTNRINSAARKMYTSMGYKEAGVVACVFNGIPDVGLVCFEKRKVHGIKC